MLSLYVHECRTVTEIAQKNWGVGYAILCITALHARKSMFFSEEKNQKTFNSAWAAPCRPWPENLEAAET
jgi:hypothetical protein